MKVFLSWSGILSHKVACSFREWLPLVIQSVVPYVSSEDIDKGTRWSTDIAKELEESSYGIICVTRENLNAPWVHFEAGALSKSIDKANVTPFLYNVKRSEVQGPLLQFQSSVFEKDEIFKLLRSINNRQLEKERLADGNLKKAFDVWWPQLESTLNDLKGKHEEPAAAAKGPEKPRPEILEEILDLVRRQQRLLNSPEELFPPEYLSYVVSRISRDEMGRLSDSDLEDLHSLVIDLERTLKGQCEKHPELEEASLLVSKLHSRLHSLMGPREHRRRDRSPRAKEE